MKGLFVFPVNKDNLHNTGLVKKNQAIINGANEIGIEVDSLTVTDMGLYFNEKLLKSVRNSKFSRGLFNNYSFFNEIRKLDHRGYDLIWFRAGLTIPPFISLLKKIRKENSKVNLVLEYGSFPFDDEVFGYQRLLLPVHRVFSRKLKRYCSRIITYCGQEEIYGIPTIKLGNGVDTGEFQISDAVTRLDNEISLISVSSLMYWHAFDRVIRGLDAYYQAAKPINVIFHIVGEGPETSELKEMVRRRGLQKYIYFHGLKTGNELTEVMRRSHIGIGTLGMHRKKLSADSSLKNREYFARGMPFVLSTPDADFPASFPFVKYVPGDESPLDIQEVVSFYQSLRECHPDYQVQIRHYAKKHLTWAVKVGQVLQALECG